MPEPASTPCQPCLARKLKIVAIALTALLVLYLLSAGPAPLLSQRQIIDTRWVESLYFSPYTPFKIVRSVPGADALLTRHVSIWEAMTPMHGNEPRGTGPP